MSVGGDGIKMDESVFMSNKMKHLLSPPKLIWLAKKTLFLFELNVVLYCCSLLFAKVTD